ncbi:MAG: hypothetical protein ACKV22_05915 [Bryobacteraceae bacterium]
MISKQYIVPSLQALDHAYTNAVTADDAERFAKLAIIELCGWIEESMDELIGRWSRRHLKVQQNLDHCANDIVKPNYGFDYNKHFRGMLIKLIGLIGVERIEGRVDAAKHVTLKSTLGNLRVTRDSLAHTHLKGVTRTLDAPSVTMRSFQRVYDGLLDLDQTMRRTGL